MQKKTDENDQHSNIIIIIIIPIPPSTLLHTLGDGVYRIKTDTVSQSTVPSSTEVFVVSIEIRLASVNL